MNNLIPVYVGFDPREAAAYHVFCQSVIERASHPVAFIPLHKPLLYGFDGQRDGTNAFIFSRYLVPYLCGYVGKAIFVDGDMVINDDIAKLWALADTLMTYDKAVAVVKHDYTTKHPRKYIGTGIENDNVDYPRKNWSSVMVWNCGHYANRVLTPESVRAAVPAEIHRFSWLKDSQIAELPATWNHLVTEFPDKEASLYHYTLGAPGIAHYTDCDRSMLWHDAKARALRCG